MTVVITASWQQQRQEYMYSGYLELADRITSNGTMQVHRIIVDQVRRSICLFRLYFQ